MKKIIVYMAQTIIKLLSKLINKLDAEHKSYCSNCDREQQLFNSLKEQLFADCGSAPAGFRWQPVEFSNTFCRADEEEVETNKGITIHIPRVCFPQHPQEIKEDTK